MELELDRVSGPRQIGDGPDKRLWMRLEDWPQTGHNAVGSVARMVSIII
jgi:hypothetical protein